VEEDYLVSVRIFKDCIHKFFKTADIFDSTE